MIRSLPHSARSGRLFLAVLAVVVVAAVAAGCSASSVASPGNSLAAAPSGGVANPSLAVLPSSSGPTDSAWPVPDAILSAAILEASREASVAPVDVAVVSAEPQTWNDGSLGCPKPGFAYTQQIIEGYHVVVKAGDRTLDYRFGHGAEPVLCVTGVPGKSGYGG